MTAQSLATAHPVSPAIQSAVDMWVNVSTDSDSDRRHDLLRDKRAALLGNTPGRAQGFFAYNSLPIDLVGPADVANWRNHLEDMGLSASSVYARISRLSAFYVWLMKQPEFKERITINPVLLARPKAPKPYQSESTKSLGDKDAIALLRVAQYDARMGDIAAMRDYAMLRFYFATGKRRKEIVQLKWSDLRVNGVIELTAKHKGGTYEASEIKDQGVKEALFAYLKATQRWDSKNDLPEMLPEGRLWLRHDRAAKGEQPVTSHGFVKALKLYAARAGIGDIHLHQTRHTVARMVGEESGDIGDVQTILGHADRRTTEVYLARIAVKKDKYSNAIAKRLKLD